MSRGTDNFRPTPAANWDYSERDYGAYHVPYNHNEPNRAPPPFPRSRFFQVTPDVRAGRPLYSPRSYTERMITWSFGLASGFPGHNISSAQIVFLDSNTAREANSRPRGIIQDSRSGFTGQRSSVVPTVPEEDSRLTHEEQKKALTKLKKEIYTPTPKRLTRRLGRSYGANTQDALNETGKDRDEDGKRCAICLDDFEPRQEVVLTPCDHMFHEDCIVPWVKSQGQCPVCRSQFGERKSGSSSNLNNSTIPHMAANDLVAGELMSLVRSMEEVFQWGHGPPR